MLTAMFHIQNNSPHKQVSDIGLYESYNINCVHTLLIPVLLIEAHCFFREVRTKCNADFLVFGG